MQDDETVLQISSTAGSMARTRDGGNQELGGTRLLYAHSIWVSSQGHARLAIRPVGGSTTLAAPNYRPLRY